MFPRPEAILLSPTATHQLVLWNICECHITMIRDVYCINWTYTSGDRLKKEVWCCRKGSKVNVGTKQLRQSPTTDMDRTAIQFPWFCSIQVTKTKYGKDQESRHYITYATCFLCLSSFQGSASLPKNLWARTILCLEDRHRVRIPAAPAPPSREAFPGCWNPENQLYSIPLLKISKAFQSSQIWWKLVHQRMLIFCEYTKCAICSWIKWHTGQSPLTLATLNRKSGCIVLPSRL